MKNSLAVYNKVYLLLIKIIKLRSGREGFWVILCHTRGASFIINNNKYCKQWFEFGRTVPQWVKTINYLLFVFKINQFYEYGPYYYLYCAPTSAFIQNKKKIVWQQKLDYCQISEKTNRLYLTKKHSSNFGCQKKIFC